MGANAFAWTLDPIGNRISATKNQEPENYSANFLNQYTQISDGVTNLPTYDLDGNLTRSVTLSGVEWVTNDFTWDAENRLTSVISNGTVIASFKYDYMSRRYEKATAAGTNTFLWDGWLPVQETSSDGTTNIYCWALDLSGTLQGAGGIGGLVCVIRNGTPYYPVADGNGNITDYITANGAVVAHREFDAFGNTIVVSGAVNDFHFWFSSKYLDQESGLYYYGYRYYQPSTGRWLSRDPLEEEGGLNVYLYCVNASVNGIDAHGEFVQFIAGPIINVGLGYGLAVLSGSPYTLRNAITDAALGALSGGMCITRAAQIARLGKCVKIRGQLNVVRLQARRAAGRYRPPPPRPTPPNPRPIPRDPALDRIAVEYVTAGRLQLRVQVLINNQSRGLFTAAVSSVAQAVVWVNRLDYQGDAYQLDIHQEGMDYDTPGDGSYALSESQQTLTIRGELPSPNPELRRIE